MNHFVMSVENIPTDVIINRIFSFSKGTRYRYKNCLWYIETDLTQEQVKALLNPATIFSLNSFFVKQ